MKKLLLSTALLAAAHFPAHAVTITLDCEVLRDASGGLMPISGIVVLTAATTGSFSGPTPTSFVSGTEIMLQEWDLSAWGTAGVFSGITDDLPFAGAWDSGDPLRIYWYPTLSLASTEPGVGTSYGSYRDPLGIDDSAPWVTPGEGDTIGLKFYTSGASFLPILPGSNSAESGWANLTIGAVPEPGTAAVGLLALFAAMGLRHRRQRLPIG